MLSECSYKPMCVENCTWCSVAFQYPEVFMTDNCDKEKGALQEIWPNAHQYLCHFHIMQAEWRWLCDSKNAVLQEKRQELMRLFQKVLNNKIR